MPGIRFVFFDVGGTILDVDYRHLREVLTEVRERGGRGDRAAGDPGVPPDELPGDEAFAAAEKQARAWFLGEVRESGVPDGAWEGYFERVYEGAGVRADDLPELLRRLWKRNVETGIWQRAATDAAPALEALRRRGLRLGAISNSEGRVEKDIALAGLGDYFECVIDSHIVGVRKPDPKIFEIALDRLGARPGESAYVGDIYGVDVRGARAAGLAPILVDRWRLQLDADCPRIESLADLDALFAGSPA